jgi:ABC-type Co2+ transport system permease subunit
MDATTALWAAIAAPFMARWAVAWTVWLRLRGLPPASANVEPRRQRSDYPAPNNARAAALVTVVAIVLAWPVALLFSVVTPAAVAFGIWVVSTIASIAYLIRRILLDDRRTRELLADRLVRESQQDRPSSTPN